MLNNLHSKDRGQEKSVGLVELDRIMQSVRILG